MSRLPWILTVALGLTTLALARDDLAGYAGCRIIEGIKLRKTPGRDICDAVLAFDAPLALDPPLVLEAVLVRERAAFLAGAFEAFDFERRAAVQQIDLHQLTAMLRLPPGPGGEILIATAARRAAGGGRQWQEQGEVR